LYALLATARSSLKSQRELALKHLRRILRNYLEYVHGSRTHLTLDKDAPEHRKRESIDGGKVIALPTVGGPHHRYTRRAA
jgi:hypothetical protein